ncbi:FAD-dependent oxidoreductase [Sporolituus thermophilus]|uniref:NADPH-dependent glutamate synthase beta chain n=1 Tax=Sporolituus thermophilus DSM 23256 TaxID=1123285 RepID=A0A1G7MC71_9FIRM|nr:FAD-dependent oxidoreductase [Sporolituus thermophilus]SDF59343.1 NADPH-dependent glutamate synthase beta chain [Sporolituus thermophilus DSM 23256]
MDQKVLLEVTVKGQVRRPGAYSVQPGHNLLDIIFGYAGGMATNRFLLKAILVGGAAGHFAGEAELQQPVSQSQEIMVFDEGSCLVNVVRLLLVYNHVTLLNSKEAGCQVCTAATAEAVKLLERLTTSVGTARDVAELARIAGSQNPDCPSRCAALRPLKTAMALWPDEFAAHGTGRCPASICSELMLSPCVNSCPANVDLPGTIALMQMGKFGDAIALGRHDNPLFLTCGYVCEEPPCQKNCKRFNFDEAVYSQSLHRYAGDEAVRRTGSLVKALTHPTLKPGPATGKKVAVVGAGPAGLAAAYFLARLGHKVTVYEKNDAAGGMAAYGIPAYRLPRTVLAAEVAAIIALGVELKTGQALGREITLAGLKEQYDAVLLAIGAGASRRLGIPGEDLPGVMPALAFLHQAATGGAVEVGRRVLVVGGGNVAVDAARTARRLGAEQVDMMCVEDRFEMPATVHEIAGAEAEGVRIKELAVPVEFSGDGRVAAVRYAPVVPGPYDAKGRRWPPKVLTDQCREAEYDTVIVAIGQAPDLACLADAGITRNGPFIAHTGGQAIGLSAIFVAGDCGGPVNTVVKAVGSGKEVAYAIHNHLTGRTDRLTSPLRGQLGCYTGDYTCLPASRVQMPEQDAASRTGNFDLVELGLSDEQARYEMLRCICAAKGGVQ